MSLQNVKHIVVKITKFCYSYLLESLHMNFYGMNFLRLSDITHQKLNLIFKKTLGYFRIQHLFCYDYKNSKTKEYTEIILKKFQCAGLNL